MRLGSTVAPVRKENEYFKSSCNSHYAVVLREESDSEPRLKSCIDTVRHYYYNMPQVLLAVLSLVSSDQDTLHQRKSYDAIISLGGGQTRDGGVPERVQRRSVCNLPACRRLIPLTPIICFLSPTNKHTYDNDIRIDSSWLQNNISRQDPEFPSWCSLQAPRTNPTRATSVASRSRRALARRTR